MSIRIWEPGRLRRRVLQALFSWQAKKMARVLSEWSDQPMGKDREELPCYRFEP